MKRNLILRNKSIIDDLFENGKYISNKLIMLRVLETGTSGFLFAVSSKRFKRAVDRNRIKRLMRESVKDINVVGKSIAIVYVGKELPTFDEVDRSIKDLLKKI